MKISDGDGFSMQIGSAYCNSTTAYSNVLQKGPVITEKKFTGTECQSKPVTGKNSQ